MARGPQLVIIYWRDIPTQVNGMHQREKHQIQLPPRFMKAVDRAAMTAGITSNSAYVEEWRRETRPVDVDALAAETKALAEQLETAFPLPELDRLVATGGWSPATHDPLDIVDEPS